MAAVEIASNNGGGNTHTHTRVDMTKSLNLPFTNKDLMALSIRTILYRNDTSTLIDVDSCRRSQRQP